MKVIMINEEKLDQLKTELCKELKLDIFDECDPEVQAALKEARRKTHYWIHDFVDKIKKS